MALRLPLPWLVAAVVAILVVSGVVVWQSMAPRVPAGAAQAADDSGVPEGPAPGETDRDASGQSVNTGDSGDNAAPGETDRN